MKIRITLKDPDGIYGCVEDALKEFLPEGLSDAERDALLEVRRDETSISKWIEYGDYMYVEIDTEADTARVLTVAEAHGKEG